MRPLLFVDNLNAITIGKFKCQRHEDKFIVDDGNYTFMVYPDALLSMPGEVTYWEEIVQTMSAPRREVHA